MSGRWVSFDCFGTLVDWHSGFRAIFERIAGERADELEEAYHRFEAEVERESFRLYSDVTRIATERAAESIGLALGRDDASSLAREWGTLPVFRDTRPALNELREGGWKLAVLTNCDLAMFARTKAALDVPLDLVITAEEVRSYKPAAGHFTTFRERTKPESWVHVACSWYHDIVPARALGVPRIWIDRDKTGDDPFAASIVKDDLHHLREAVERTALQTPARPQ